MTTAYSTNLGLALPVQGELAGTWGDTVNNGITQYSDIAIAGTLTLTGDGAVTLANTNGNSSGTNIGSTTAQYAALKIVGPLTAVKVITAPSSSKTYIVLNTDSTYGVTIKASGQTGVTIAAGQLAQVIFNGTDYVQVNAPAAGSTNQLQYNSAGALAGSSNLTFDGTTLTVNTLTGKFKAYTEVVTTATVSTATYNIDTSLSNIFDLTLGNNVTFTFTNAPTSGISRPVTIILRQDATGNRTASFTNAKYTNGTAPTLSTGANQIDVLTYFTVNGGTFWFGTFAMANVS